MNFNLKAKRLGRTVTAGLVLALGVGTATVAAGIDDDQEVFDRLFYTAVANEIRENCDTISARRIRATFYILNILAYAKSQGYSKAEIDTYRHNPVQIERLKSVGYGYLEAQGVDRTAGTGYCELGRVEMAKKSQIGRLLQ